MLGNLGLCLLLHGIMTYHTNLNQTTLCWVLKVQKMSMASLHVGVGSLVVCAVVKETEKSIVLKCLKRVYTYNVARKELHIGKDNKWSHTVPDPIQTCQTARSSALWPHVQHKVSRGGAVGVAGGAMLHRHVPTCGGSWLLSPAGSSPAPPRLPTSQTWVATWHKYHMTVTRVSHDSQASRDSHTSITWQSLHTTMQVWFFWFVCSCDVRM